MADDEHLDGPPSSKRPKLDSSSPTGTESSDYHYLDLMESIGLELPDELMQTSSGSDHPRSISILHSLQNGAIDSSGLSHDDQQRLRSVQLSQLLQNKQPLHCLSSSSSSSPGPSGSGPSLSSAMSMNLNSKNLHGQLQNPQISKSLSGDGLSVNSAIGGNLGSVSQQNKQVGPGMNIPTGPGVPMNGPHMGLVRGMMGQMATHSEVQHLAMSRSQHQRMQVPAGVAVGRLSPVNTNGPYHSFPPSSVSSLSMNITSVRQQLVTSMASAGHRNPLSVAMHRFPSTVDTINNNSGHVHAQPQVSNQMVRQSIPSPCVSNQVSPGTSTSPQGPAGADPEKRKLIQQQLVLLLHAHKCQRRENLANGEVRQCALPHCRTMKNVLTHMTTCQAGKTCPMPHCASSRQIISHWKNCTRADCPVCLPLKQANEHKRTLTQTGQPSHDASQQSPVPVDKIRAYAALGLSYTSNNINQMNMRSRMAGAMGNTQIHDQVNTANQNSGTGGENLPGGSVQQLAVQTQSQAQAHNMPQAQNQCSALQQVIPNFSPSNSEVYGNSICAQGLFTTLFPPSSMPHATPSKEWHHSVTQDLRNYLVQKLVQTIFPAPDPAAMHDKRMYNLVAYAWKVEGEMYEMANSRSEYYHMLAEKIYKIQKELEEKRMRRKELQQQQIISGPSLSGSKLGSVTVSSNQIFTQRIPGTAVLTGHQRIIHSSITTSREFYNQAPPNQLASGASHNQGLMNSNHQHQSMTSQQYNSGLAQQNSMGGSYPQNLNSSQQAQFNQHFAALTPAQQQHYQEALLKRQMQHQQQRQSFSQQHQQMRPENELHNSQQRALLASGGSQSAPQPSPDQQGVVAQPAVGLAMHTSSSVHPPLSVGQPATPTFAQVHTPTCEVSNHSPTPDCVTTLSPAVCQPGFNTTGGDMSQHSHSALQPARVSSVPPQAATPYSYMVPTPTQVRTPTPVLNMTPVSHVSQPLTPARTPTPSSSNNGTPAEVKQEGGKHLPEVKSEQMDTTPTAASALTPLFNDESTIPVKEEATKSPGNSETDEAATSNVETKPQTGENVETKPNQKVFKADELRQALMPTLEKLYKQDPESLPFRQPVDPSLLQIPDYFEIIKKPMDLSTIKRKLDTGQYQDPWQYVEDVWLMFDNAWLYNRKTSRVYRYCSKLAEVFEQEVDPVMHMLGYCCGRKYVFNPQVLCCFGKQLCTIPRDSKYWSYQNSSRTFGLVSDRYTYCQKCFAEIPGETVALGDDPSQPQTAIMKNQFVEIKNDHLEMEPFIECTDCGRRLHQICVLHMDCIWPQGFFCDNCLKARGQKQKENKYTAKRLPTTKMGSFIESRVNSFLKKKDVTSEDVSIRLVASSDKVVEVKPGMKTRFVENGELCESFPYRAKALYAFQEQDGADVCFFGMHVQEYGSDCPMPNTRRAYIAYLDSVHFFHPKQYRTAVYHEILLAYMDYCKQLGFTMAHIWACPPSEGDDYIFHCHPTDQKIPKPKRLQEWYKKMLDKGIIERIVLDYKDIYKQAVEDNVRSSAELPYFEGDFWPNVLEECIKELDQEEEEKRRAEESAMAAVVCEENVEEIEAPDGKKGKKKAHQKVKKSNKNKNNHI